MFKLFKPANVRSLQKKYDKLTKEAYDLAKLNPEESVRKQKEAQEVHQKIIDMTL